MSGTWVGWTVSRNPAIQDANVCVFNLPNLRHPDLARSTYESAIDTLKQELGEDEFRSAGLTSQSSIRDVQNALAQAMRKYESRSKQSVFDTLSQHYPEYVSLAWGAFNLLSIAGLNHEELISEISKAVSKFADVLPRTLHSILYQTQRMRDAVASVYAKTIEFAILAIKWYKKGKGIHNITAIIQPFKIGFKPIMDEIAERSRRVGELASAASKAEIRSLHLTVRNLEKEMYRLRDLLVSSQVLQNQILLDLRYQKQLFVTSQLGDIHRALSIECMPDCEKSLAFCKSLKIRHKHRSSSQIPLAELAKLRLWLADSSSSLLLAESIRVKTSSLDFSVDFLGLVQE
ncbi:putative Nacht domain protein [Seiridium unicorne]|uniref:Nacht domain protein n=1 Tax=Seiridium unicorne TaxID=138068 RepID=A0ABR2VDF6_9PEZI